MQIKKIFLFFMIFWVLRASATWFPWATEQRTFSLMLDPAGDAKHVGRTLEDSFERGTTLQCAQALKQALEKEESAVRVTLTRLPGEIVEPLQNAHFANRLDVDCYISIHVYQTEDPKPHLHLYYVSYGDDFVSKTFDVHFYPYDKVHTLALPTTKKWVSMMHATLNADIYTKQFQLHPPCALPFKPLLGIKAPAIAVEIGLKKSNDWRYCIDALAQSIHTIITT
jgi:N-acetylmuramoyl-L-alanine amidase